MKRKTIAEHAVDVLRETDNSAVMWGDSGLLDQIAERAGINDHPLWRWQKVLAGLERSPLFEKRLVRELHGREGNQVVRLFRLRETI